MSLCVSLFETLLEKHLLTVNTYAMQKWRWLHIRKSYYIFPLAWPNALNLHHMHSKSCLEKKRRNSFFPFLFWVLIFFSSTDFCNFADKYVACIKNDTWCSKNILFPAVGWILPEKRWFYFLFGFVGSFSGEGRVRFTFLFGFRCPKAPVMFQTNLHEHYKSQ